MQPPVLKPMLTNILGDLEMSPTQANNGLAWATHLFHPLRCAVGYDNSS
jgi:hypothetical protein